MNPTLCTFTLPDNTQAVMGVWLTDEDGDMILTAFDRHLVYSVYSGSSWSTPEVFAENITTKETLALSCLDGAVALGYTYQTPDPNYVYEPPADPTAIGYDEMQNPYIYKAFYRYFNTTSMKWNDEQRLSESSDFDGDLLNEHNVAFSTRDGRFVATWMHNDTLVYRILSPLEPGHPIGRLSDGEPTSMVTMSEHPEYTVVTWTGITAGGYYFAILEAGTQTFGKKIFIPKTKPKVTDVYARAVLLSQDSGDPLFLRFYTERDYYLDPDTNNTVLGAARIEYDVISLIPNITLSSVTFYTSGNDSTNVSIVISSFNAGALGSGIGEVKLEAYQGTRDGPNMTSYLGTGDVPALPAGANGTVTIPFTPTWSFQGYIWIIATDTADNSQLWNTSVPYYQPNIMKIALAKSKVSPDSLTITVTMWRINPFSKAPITIPMRIWTRDAMENPVLLASTTVFDLVHATAVAPTFFPIEVNASLVTDDIQIMVGDGTPFTLTTVPPISTVGSFDYELPTPNLIIVNPEKVIVLDSFISTALLQVNVTNDGITPLENITLGVFLYSANFLDSDDPAYSQSLGYAVIPYLPPMAETPIQVSLATWEYTGSMIISVMVNPYKNFEEKVYDDNAVLKPITIYPQWKLSTPKDFVTLDITTGKIQFAVLNAGDEALKVTIPVYEYNSDTNNYTLLEQVVFTNVSSNKCAIGTTVGANFTDSSSILITLPPYYSGKPDQVSTLVTATEAVKGRLPNCNGTLFASPSIADIPPQKVIAGQNISLTINADNADASFILQYAAAQLPQGATFVDNGDNTATFFWTAPLISRRSDTRSSTYTVSMHMVDDGQTYGDNSFPIIIVTPIVINATHTLHQGGLITITGENFGNDVTQVSVAVGSNTCENVSMVVPSSVLTCIVPAGSGTDLHVYVSVGQSNNLDDNTAFSYVTGFILPSDFLDAVIYPEILYNYTMSLTDAENKDLSLIVQCSHMPANSSCTVYPAIIVFTDGSTEANFSIVVSTPDSYSAKDLIFSVNYTSTTPAYVLLPQDTNFGFGAYVQRNDVVDTAGGYIYLDGYRLNTNTSSYNATFVDYENNIIDTNLNVSSNFITIRIPEGYGENYNLTISGGDRPEETFVFSYGAPVIKSMVPRNIPYYGGNITFVGNNFGPKGNFLEIFTLLNLTGCAVTNHTAIQCRAGPADSSTIGKTLDLVFSIGTYDVRNASFANIKYGNKPRPTTAPPVTTSGSATTGGSVPTTGESTGNTSSNGTSTNSTASPGVTTAGQNATANSTTATSSNATSSNVTSSTTGGATPSPSPSPSPRPGAANNQYNVTIKYQGTCAQFRSANVTFGNVTIQSCTDSTKRAPTATVVFTVTTAPNVTKSELQAALAKFMTDNNMPYTSLEVEQVATSAPTPAPTPKPTPIPATTLISPDPTLSTTGQASHGDNGHKRRVGLGVGLTIAGLVIIGAGIAVYFYRRRRALPRGKPYEVPDGNLTTN
eukprot:Phypoly_transcript_00436.p1 GENE.Phypoly_transcript_00436~~Phypoly_transcript_00436.p1  ORF type:complete len:1554 (+),score=261.65 Phypoly_transcript_00436:224-4663(+)